MLLAKNQVPVNRFPLWKYVLIVVLVILAVIYALPNIFGESPAVQISAKGGNPITDAVISEVKQTLQQNQISYHQFTVAPYGIEMRFNNTDAQMLAQESLQSKLGNDYSVAINLAANTPSWLLALGAEPMKLGLDLRGGMYFLLDVDMQTVLNGRIDNYASQLRTDLRTQNIRYAGILTNPQRGVVLNFRDADAANNAQSYIGSHYPDLSLTHPNPTTLYAAMTPAAVMQAQSYAVDQVVQVMRNRVNQLGVAEASVAKQGSDRVVIELPGVQDAARAKEVLGGTATLKVMMVNDQVDSAAVLKGTLPLGSSLYYMADGTPVALYDKVVLTGNDVVSATSTFDSRTNLPAVQVNLSGSQVNYFSRITRENVGHPMAIVLVQTNFVQQLKNGKEVSVPETSQQVINVATINEPLGSTFIITGIGNQRMAQDLALTIRAGALPAPVQIVEEKQIGPTLGAQNIHTGAVSVVVAMILVMIFMAVYYRLFGLVADVALCLNLIFIVAVMSILPGATLTLPGIAGIVLNVGMAIDSNVLIFERIREELRNKMPVQAAIHAGYQRAFATIVDANVTTLIVAVILFAIGTGAIKGFAVTLMIGIVTSMFTAITVTRGIVNLIYGRKKQLKSVSIGI